MTHDVYFVTGQDIIHGLKTLMMKILLLNLIFMVVQNLSNVYFFTV